MTKYRKSLLYCILFCLFIATFAIYDVWTGYIKETTAVRERVANTSFLIGEWIRGAFTASDYVLQDVANQVTPKELLNINQKEKTSKFLESKLETLPSYFKEIGVTNKDCIATSGYIVPPRSTFLGIDYSSEQWCKVLQQDNKASTYISNSFFDVNRMIVTQSRKIRTSTGKFNGIAGLILELGFFQKWLNKITIDKHGVMTIIDKNMILLARKPVATNVFGKKVNNKIYKSFISSSKSYIDFNGRFSLNDEKRFYGLRKVGGLPFIIIVGEADRDWLESWQTRLIGTFLSVFLLWGMAILLLRNYWKQLDQQKKLFHQAQTDPLTKALNRRGFMEKAEIELKRVQRYQTDFAVLLLDIDLFKIINDSHGHATGDRALITFTQACSETLRDIDVLGRIGGDEFAILLPNTTSDEAVIVAERIRQAIETSKPLNDDNISVLMTSSIGVVMGNQEITNVSDLLALADEALYISKEKGRNRVEFFSGKS